MTVIERGISLRRLEQEWRAAGGIVQQRKRTGESRLIHPELALRSGLYNDRRKDAPLALVRFAQKILDPPCLEIVAPVALPAPALAIVADVPTLPETPMPDITAAVHVPSVPEIIDALELQLRRRGFTHDAAVKAREWSELVTVRADGSTDIDEVAEMAKRDHERKAQAPPKPAPVVTPKPAAPRAAEPEPEFLTAEQVAELAGVTKGWLYRLNAMDAGPKCFKIGRNYVYQAASAKEWAATYVATHRAAEADVSLPSDAALARMLELYVESSRSAKMPDARSLARLLSGMLRA